MAVFAGRQGEVKATNGYYVGNGYIGVGSLCSITFDKLPNEIVVEADPTSGTEYKLLSIPTAFLTNEFASKRAFSLVGERIIAESDLYIKCDGKTVSWYSNVHADQQMNKSGVTYKWWSY